MSGKPANSGSIVAVQKDRGQKRPRCTTEEFIEKARLVHGDLYDYSKVVYINYSTKVIITCPKHGDFEQVPHYHTSGNGCQRCGGNYKSNTKDFIRKAKEKHGEKYDYSKTNYVNCSIEVTIICTTCQREFQQKPVNHITGRGCHYCGGTYKVDTAEFLKRAKETHGNKYDYSKVIYVDSLTEVTITCQNGHGDFQQTPVHHIRGSGCLYCVHRSYKYNTAEFIEKAKEKHGDDYDYSKVLYTNNWSKVIIICKKGHDQFYQVPWNHLKGAGCPICSGSYRYDTEGFIKKAKEKHGDTYDYTKVQYVKSTTKVLIYCKKGHGEFQQLPSNHLSGHGCFKCSSGYSQGQIQWLDFIASFHSIHIRHAANDGEFTIPETRYRADGYCEETNTVYEYHGDYWHGNPKKFNKDDMNQSSKKTFGELYDQTLKRENDIRALGYNLVVMWESDWLRINRCVRKLQQKFKGDK